MVDSVSRTSLLDAPTGDLVLRICGTSRNGQVVRLRSPKCVIGSGPGCTFRLLARGVRRVHCLIVRGPAATVIRRWSADTLLNGRSFTDAPLRAGDRLSVGPLELEVLDPGPLPPRPQRDFPQAQLSQETATAGLERQDAAELDALCSELSARQAALDARQGVLDARDGELGRRKVEMDSHQVRLDTRQGELDAPGRAGFPPG